MRSPVVVVARSTEAEETHRPFEDQLVGVLTRDHGLDVLVVPHVYYLDADHPATKRLASIEGPIALGAWLSPRASHWILVSLGLAADTTPVACVDLRAYESPRACAGDMLGSVGHGVGRQGPGQVSEISDPVRTRWYPVVDYERCRGCRQCHDFCLFEVYDVDDEHGVRVVRPDNCKPGCPACARVCPQGAIMFPHYADPAIAGDLDATQIPPGEREAPSAESPSPTAEGSDSPAVASIDDLIDALDELDHS